MTIQTPPDVPVAYGKAIGSIVGGAVSVLVIYLLNRFLPPPPLPDYVGGALQTLITAAITFYVPHQLMAALKGQS